MFRLVQGGNVIAIIALMLPVYPVVGCSETNGVGSLEGLARTELAVLDANATYALDDYNTHTYDVEWADWDGDGDLDLATGHYQQARVWENTGGEYTEVWSTSLNNSCYCVAWGDLDGDGDPDLAVGDYVGPTTVYENTGGGLTLAWSAPYVPQIASAQDLAWGDWDGDGDLDLAEATPLAINVYENTGGNLALATSTTGYYYSTSVDWADWDGDGDLDIAAGTGSQGDPDRVFENTGGGLSLVWQSNETEMTYSVAWGDVDDDGDPDLVTGNCGTGVCNGGANRLYENTGSTLTLAWTSPELDATYDVAWEDWDDDGDLDLATANYLLHQGGFAPVRVYENVGGSLTLNWSSAQTGHFTSVDWGDWDDDGDLDLVAGGDNGSYSYVFENPCTDLDGDGYGFPGDPNCPDGVDEDCDDDDPAIGPHAQETYDGIDNNCDGLYDEGVLPSNAVIITEVMQNPDAVSDDVGEWFEIYNSTAIVLNLIGLEVSDLDLDSFTVDTDAWVDPYSFAVFARNGDYQVNGGVAADYSYGDGFSLANAEDEILLEHGGVLLDSIEFDGGLSWPDPTGTSMSLDPGAFDVAGNDDGANWCETPSDPSYELDQGDYGTPRGANPTCCSDEDGDGYLDQACGGDDCDDSDQDVNPAAEETCNLVDDDCDGIVDEDEALDAPTWYQDVDGDGFGDPAVPHVACYEPDGHVGNADDCNDLDPAQHPGADEFCNGEDDDCDGMVDEDDALDATTWYQDADGDGYGDAGEIEVDCDALPGYVLADGDCDDTDPAVHPSATEICNLVDDDCDGEVDEQDAAGCVDHFRDDDGDGYGLDADSFCLCSPTGPYSATTGGDCDDTAPQVNPGQVEATCNTLDDDCDPSTPDDIDDDGDGSTVCGGDCEDSDPTVYPGAQELCDGLDNDCNGLVPPTEIDGDADGYRTCDGDCDDGDPATYPGATEVCDGADNDCDGDIDESFDDDADGYTTCEGDCNDNLAYVYPGAVELCDGIDGDCDGDIDNGFDLDTDGYTSCGGDCDDQDPTVYPDALEDCDGIDQDCDGLIDEDFDLDLDGWTTCEGDCEDGDAAVFPGAEEICNGGVDDDCDPTTDEEVDADGDGFSVCDGDCDDTEVDAYPDALEACDGIDNDCDGVIDQDTDDDGDGYVVCDGDCNDTDGGIYPGAPEGCDGLDTDCDGQLDPDEVDDDGDEQMVCEGDCDDGDPLTYDGAPEQCDQIDNDCDGDVDEDVDEDLDGDGWNACQGDCDNEDADTYPGAVEACDGADNDCDGDLPDDETDEDGDGWLVCQGDCDDQDADLNLDDADSDGFDTCSGDCDDEDAAANPEDQDGDGWSTCDDPPDCNDVNDSVSPGYEENCVNGVDDNCDGLVDGDDPECAGDDDGDDDDSTEVDDDDDGGADCQCRAVGGYGATSPVWMAGLVVWAMLRRRNSR